MRHLKLRHARAGMMATTAVLSAMLAPAMLTMLTPVAASAQDYTSGAVSISIKDSAGKPVAGATVVLTSTAQGISKTFTTDASGAASAGGLAPGDYSVAVKASGYDDYKGTASVIVSQEVSYTYALNTEGSVTTEIVVKGKRVRQDFNRTTAGLSVDLTTLTSQQAIGRNIESVMLLAPTTIRSQNATFDEPSIGGGSAAENAYYINGLNITNPNNYVGGANVPFDFYKTVDVQTSGYPAEFGRATGGVVNSTTKSGTNDFMFAVHGNFAPNSLRATAFETSDTTTPAKFIKNEGNSLTVESGGALIKDKLFLYGLVELNENEADYASTSGFYETSKSNNPFWGAKLDYYLTPNQHFEYTYFDTTTDSHITRYAYSGAASDGSDGAIGGMSGKAVQTTGGQNWVGKYTGNITDWFTVSAAYGINNDQNLYAPGDPTQPYARQYDPTTASYVAISKLQPFSAAVSNEVTQRKFYRLDADLRFNALGKHHVRFGFDNEDLDMTHTTALPGSQPIRYTLRPSQGYGYIIYEKLGGHVSAKDSAAYIQDSWDITPLLNMQIGLRADDFKQSNLSGQQVLNLTGNVAPRLGVSWRPSEDSNWRFTAFYGQYYIPPAMNLSFRGKDLYYEEGFDMPAGGYTFDPTTGLPLDMGTPDPDIIGGTVCPTSDAGSAPVHIEQGAAACAVFGAGVQEPAAKKAAVGLKATRESEYTLGTSYRANDLWTFDLTYVHRSLNRVSEDTDFAPQINQYCADHGISGCNFYNEYHVWNVGQSVTLNTFSTLSDGTTQITLNNLNFPTPKRDFDSLTFGFKRAFDGKWGLQGSYTWSKSYGNYEGTVLTVGDGTGQTDAGSTLLYDYPELAENSTGYLPNSRDHTFKIWGSYAITPDLLVGANLLVVSPAYLSCLGTYPDVNAIASGYGAVSHFCFNGTTSVASPMGKGAKSDWTKNIDLSLRYTLPASMTFGGKLVLRGDIFNLFNNKQVISRDMASDDGFDSSGNLVANPRFGEPYQYNTARYMRVGFDLNY